MHAELSRLSSDTPQRMHSSRDWGRNFDANDADGLRDDASMASFATDLGGSLGPRRPRPHKVWKKRFVKLLVVGDSGLGKTTLTRNLMSTPNSTVQLHDGSETSREQFIKNPEAICTTIKWNDEEDKVTWIFKIQDTPGYGDDMDINKSVRAVQSYIEQQNWTWLKAESDKFRNKDPSEIDDPRVDLCIFCLPPHRLRPIDIRFMYEIGRYVPIVPVVTKADIMTTREAQLYRSEVVSRLRNPDLPGCNGPINTFEFSKTALVNAQIYENGGRMIPPFFVVASNDINQDLLLRKPNPMFWPERRYIWGQVEAFNPEHSDLFALRKLLLEISLDEIVLAKAARYETWRGKQLSSFRLLRRLRRLLFITAFATGLAVLAVQHTGIDLQDVGRSVWDAVVRQRDRWLLAKRDDVDDSDDAIEIGDNAATSSSLESHPIQIVDDSADATDATTDTAIVSPQKQKPWWQLG